MSTDVLRQYYEALDELSALVAMRDQELLMLDTLAALPLSIDPDAGNVVEFDVETAQALRDGVRHETERIGECMQEINRLAEEAGMRGARWLRARRGGSGSPDFGL